MVHGSQAVPRSLGEGGGDCWRRPPVVSSNAIFDGAIFVDSGYTGCAVIVCNEVVILCSVSLVLRGASPSLSWWKSWQLVRLSWLRSWHVDDIILEFNNQKLWQAIKLLIVLKYLKFFQHVKQPFLLSSLSI